MEGVRVFDDDTQRKMLEGVNDKFESGTNVLNESDIAQVSESAGLSLQDGKRLLGRLISPDGPIIGEPITSDENGLIGLSVEDVYL